MRELKDVTDAEVKAAYESDLTLTTYLTFEEVKANDALMIILKNKIISHENAELLGNVEEKRHFSSH